MNHRIAKARNALESAGADAFLSFARFANEYLTGFRGSSSCFILTRDDAWLLTDFRYAEIAGRQVKACNIDIVTGTLETRAGERLEQLGAHAVLFDSQVTTVHQVTTVQAAFSGTLSPEDDLVRELRWIKDAEEIDKLRAASALGEEVLACAVAALAPGIRERELAALIEYEFRKRGAQGSSFEPIVLFGARSSLPHGVPGEKTLENGDIVLIDMGCIKDSYCSDLTRTYAYGRIPGIWFEEIYRITLEAQLAALAAVRPGALGREVDAAARSIIKAAGHGAHFGHGLGHGVGLEVHEWPRLNMQSETVLEPGMVVTIEPGIYLPGQGGVRIEDLAVVTSSGCTVLTQSSKELEVLAL